MKIAICCILIMLVIGYSPLYSQQETIVENVSVEWWVIPIFALDKTGEPVMDLQSEDIALQVDNKSINSFSLIKKDYTQSTQPDANKPENMQSQPYPISKKNVFLLFDTALSTKGSTNAAKMLAQEIINQADKDTVFFIMTIEPFAGLTYAGGQTSDKNQLLDILSQKVKGKANSRVPDPEEVIVNVGEKYDADDVSFLSTSVSKFYKRKSKSFAQSFETLYYALNSINDNKIVYLFTEGISTAIQQADKGDNSMYRLYLDQIATQLGRCGAVLFIINPFAGAAADLSQASGKDSLQFLAQKSGGKYLEGNDEKLINTITKLHKAYYEIAFPAKPQTTNGTLAISIHSKSKNIEIHTLSITEKSRNYSQMKAIEQEVLALNLISGNPLYKTGITVEPVKIKKVSPKKDTITYRLELPNSYLNRSLDLYKIQIPKLETNGNSNTTPQTYTAGTRVEKATLRTDNSKIKITFKQIKSSEETFFVIIDPEAKSALVHGMPKKKTDTYALSIPESIEDWATKDIIREQKATEKPAETNELERILKGAAGYCERLKQAAFHYLCKEKIVETQNPLTYRHNLGTDVAADPGHPQFTASSGREERESIDKVKTQKHLFNYRLIKKQDHIQEEREIETDYSKDKKNPNQSQNHFAQSAKSIDANILKDIRFLSSKAVFAPITLLESERQIKYHFRLLGNEHLKDRPTVVIEAYPRDENDSNFIYGKIWIDKENFSVLKIKANPNSIVGYDKLRKLSGQLNTRLQLSLETEFYQFYEGIRFPTQIHFEESYKGGPFISKYRGSRPWKRTETLTTYGDYLFFKVNTDVTYDQIP